MGTRSGIDAQREDARLRTEYAAEAAKAERERQWRVARGTASATDLAGPAKRGPVEREAWMTVLPELRRPGATPVQKNVVRTSPMLHLCAGIYTHVMLLGLPPRCMHKQNSMDMAVATVTALA